MIDLQALERAGKRYRHLIGNPAERVRADHLAHHQVGWQEGAGYVLEADVDAGSDRNVEVDVVLQTAAGDVGDQAMGQENRRLVADDFDPQYRGEAVA